MNRNFSIIPIAVIAILFPMLSIATGPVISNVTLNFKRLFAVHIVGSSYPEKDKVCLVIYQKKLNTSIRIDYSIDPDTGIQSAMTTIDSIQTRLYPMGRTTSYSFMSDKIPSELLHVTRIGFTINKQIDKNSALSTVMLDGKEGEFKCILST